MMRDKLERILVVVVAVAMLVPACVDDHDSIQHSLTGVCVPDCEGKDCGDDGCGGSCGACGQGELCAVGQCICTENCEDVLAQTDTPESTPVDALEDGAVKDNAEDPYGDMDVPDFAGGSDHDVPENEPCEGCFLYPCAENSECNSGHCVPHANVSVCSQFCVEQCADGFSCRSVSAGPDPYYLCLSDYSNLCKPCVTDEDCDYLGTSDKCISFGSDGAFCGSACGTNSSCPEGYWCQSVMAVDGSLLEQCVPDEGICTCSSFSIKEQAQTECHIVNEFGSCSGGRTCTSAGLTDCDAAIPAVEICDSKDNDCDGEIDEDSVCCEPGVSSGKTTAGAHGMVWVEIPSGCFMMGCSPGDGECGSNETDSAGQQHAVLLESFEMLETEVTVAQYAAIMTGVQVLGLEADPTPSGDINGGGGDSAPVELVGWYHARAFCEQIGGRLPTEAEWEYAARAGTATRYYCGYAATCVKEIAWGDSNSDDGPGPHKHGVKGKDPNDYGLYDMLGNVWEWVEDCNHANYDGAPNKGYPDWDSGCGPYRVRRGGHFGSEAYGLRVSRRAFNVVPGGDDILGFRCVRVLPFCGDYTCNGNEDCDSCPDDCGNCLCEPGISSGEITSGSHGMVWVGIPTGCFMMGCSPGDEDCDDGETDAAGNQHQVTVKAFEMLETEVTEAQYAAVMTGVMVGGNEADPDPSDDYNGGGGANSPVEMVNWYHAKAFCEEIGGRLPTEAEWEYAARGGTTTKYYCGDSDSCLGNIAWYDANSDDGPGAHKHDVGNKDPNDYGLFGVLGNVNEWVEDCSHTNYDGAPYVAYPDWDTGCGSGRIHRGGGGFGGAAEHQCVSRRISGSPGAYAPWLGFRCAR